MATNAPMPEVGAISKPFGHCVRRTMLMRRTQISARRFLEPFGLANHDKAQRLGLQKPFCYSRNIVLRYGLDPLVSAGDVVGGEAVHLHADQNARDRTVAVDLRPNHLQQFQNNNN